MLGVNLKSNLDEVMNDLGVFTAQEQRRAASRALNDAARGAVTDASKKIRERYPALKAAEVKAAFSVQFSSPDSLQATVTAKGRPLSLYRFVQRIVTQRGAGGVYVNIAGETKFFPHAWVATLKTSAGGDYQVVMGREGKERYPVKVFHTIDLPGAFKVAPVMEYVQAQSESRFEKRLTASFNYMMGRR